MRVTWGVAGKRIFLLRMQIVKAPKGSKAELRCADKKKGKQCPFNRTSSKKRKKGTITLFKEVKAKNVIGKQRRTFHAGQTPPGPDHQEGLHRQGRPLQAPEGQDPEREGPVPAAGQEEAAKALLSR